MMNKTLVGGALGVGFLAGFWSKIKAVLKTIWSYFFITATVENGEISLAVSMYFWRHGNRQRAGNRTYGAWWTWMRPKERYQHVAYEKFGSGTLIFRLGFWPVLVARGSSTGNGDKDADSSAPGSGEDNRLSFTFIRGTIDPDRLVQDALDEYDEYVREGDKRIRGSRFRIHHVVGDPLRKRFSEKEVSTSSISGSENKNSHYRIPHVRFLGCKAYDLGYKESCKGSVLDTLVITPPAEQMVEEVSMWTESKDWYKGKSIPWKRGYLLVGPPGSGKTSIARAVAQHFDFPVWRYDLATLSNKDLTKNWLDMLSSTPCMALIEDIDAVFEGRKNIVGELGGGLTFDCLLNCLDGVQRTNGVLLVITSNRKRKLDPALASIAEKEGGQMEVTRPGRVDRVLHFGPFDADCRRELASRIFPGEDQLVEKLVAEGKGDVASQFSERCTSVALQRFWEENQKVVDFDGKKQEDLEIQEVSSAG